MAVLSIIYNPLAGTANLASSVNKIQSFWLERGWQVLIKPTEYAGHARKLALQSAEAGHEMVLAAGGDGTLGEVAGGLAFSETIMAPFPAGTGNSFAKELEMPRLGLRRGNGIFKACGALADGHVHKIDIGCSGQDQYWLQWLGVGIDGFIVEHIEPRSRIVRRFGRAGYLAEGLPIIPRFPGMKATITIDGQVIEDEFLMIIISNCRRYAGGHFLLSPMAILDDGKMEVWLFKGKKPLNILNHLIRIMRTNHLDNPDISFYRSKTISVESYPSLPYHRDGDPGGATPFSARIEPGALHFLVPTTAPQVLFSRPGTALADAVGL